MKRCAPCSRKRSARRLRVTSNQLSVIGYRLSVISYQLSVVSYQLSVVGSQLSVIGYRLSYAPVITLRQLLERDRRQRDDLIVSLQLSDCGFPIPHSAIPLPVWITAERMIE